MSSSSVNSTAECSLDAIDEYIYHSIVDAILNRQLTAGTRLVEAPLCQAFGVTRGVLRRVFVKLAHDGVIEIQPNRGAIIAKHSVQEIQEVFEARSMLEVATVQQLCKKAHLLDLSELHQLVLLEEQALQSANWAEWIKLSGQFHLKLVEANQNTIINNYLQTLIARSSLLLGLSEMSQSHSQHCSANEHRAILDAISAANEDLAVSLMQQHLGDYADVFTTDMQQAKQGQGLLEIFAAQHG